LVLLLWLALREWLTFLALMRAQLAALLAQVLLARISAQLLALLA
jgi:hypothetical protein